MLSDSCTFIYNTIYDQEAMLLQIYDLQRQMSLLFVLILDTECKLSLGKNQMNQSSFQLNRMCVWSKTAIHFSTMELCHNALLSL